MFIFYVYTHISNILISYEELIFFKDNKIFDRRVNKIIWDFYVICEEIII